MNKIHHSVSAFVGIALLIVGSWWIAVAANEAGSREAILRQAPGSSEAVQAYRALIAEIGVDSAQEKLRSFGLPANGETHLLNHVAGAAAYEQYGLAGLLHCRDYFLQSCYHAFFIAAIADHGLSVIPELVAPCYTASEARARQCAHGIGHGLVAWFGYRNLIEAATYCDTLKSEDSRFSAENCVDGVFMENVWAVHDGGVRSDDQWFNAEDPSFPCSDERVQDSWRSACWGNQAAMLYQFYERDIASVARACAHDAGVYSIACYDGLARQIHPLIRRSVSDAVRLCAQTGRENANACLMSIAVAEYSVGGRTFPYELCAEVGKSSSSAESTCIAMVHTARVLDTPKQTGAVAQ